MHSANRNHLGAIQNCFCVSSLQISWVILLDRLFLRELAKFFLQNGITEIYVFKNKSAKKNCSFHFKIDTVKRIFQKHFIFFLCFLPVGSDAERNTKVKLWFLYVDLPELHEPFYGKFDFQVRFLSIFTRLLNFWSQTCFLVRDGINFL